MFLSVNVLTHLVIQNTSSLTSSIPKVNYSTITLTTQHNILALDPAAYFGAVYHFSNFSYWKKKRKMKPNTVCTKSTQLVFVVEAKADTAVHTATKYTDIL